MRWPAELRALAEALATRAKDARVAQVREERRLRRASPSSCPSAVERMFGATPYLAIGPNDGDARVHGVGESLPRWSLRLCAAQFIDVLEWFAGRRAR